MKPPPPPTVDETAARRILVELCEPFFEDRSWIEACEFVQTSQLPAAARTLLDHGGHMTATLRQAHKRPIALEVLADRARGAFYSRRILLTTTDPRWVIEHGVVRINLGFVPEEVRAAILEKATPLGDVLARHRVLTRVEPKGFFRFPSGGPIVECFERGSAVEAFGRVATIHCNGDEAVELLEVVAV